MEINEEKITGDALGVQLLNLIPYTAIRGEEKVQYAAKMLREYSDNVLHGNEREWCHKMANLLEELENIVKIE